MTEALETRRPLDLDSLDALVGTWHVSGGSDGTVRYEWMPGKHFMLQHIDLDDGEGHTGGLEVIGHLRPYDGQPSADIHSRYYATNGDTLDYIYEVKDGVLTIWFGERGSPAYYRGEFSADGNQCRGRWTYPGGGGYESNMVRVAD